MCWCDTETTGLDPEKNDIIEIAIVRESKASEDTREAKIHMERPESAHPKALEVNGYTEDAWQDAEDPKTFWQALADSGILSGCIIAGQNVKFDTAFLDATFKRHNIQVDGKIYRVDYHTYDTVTLALEHLRPWLTSVSLVTVAVALGIPVKNTHSAMADVRLAMAVDRTLRRCTAQDRRTWSQVIPLRLQLWEYAGKPKDWAP